MRKGMIAASILILASLSVATVIPAGVYITNLLDPQTVMIESEIVGETMFSDFTTNVDPEILSNPYRIVSERPLIIEENYSHLEHLISVTYEDALDTALAMLEDVGPSFITWNLLVGSNSTFPPAWTFRFTFPGFSSYVVVESIGGRVIEFEIKYLHEFEPTPITLEQAENFTSEFLQTHNYTIPENARYIEGFPYDCQRFYSLVFQEYVGPVMIEESRIIVRASAFTKGIGYFQYHWFGLNDIDIIGIMGPDLVRLNLQTRLQQEENLVPQFENETNIIWDEPQLQMIGVTEGVTKLHRLSWIMNAMVNSTDEFEARFYIDAFTGNLYGLRSSESAYTEVDERLTIYSSTNLQNIVMISSMFLGASIIGLVVYGVKTRSQLT